MSKKNAKALHKIALYIRVSTEEQAKNPEGSIKSQEQRLRQYVDFKNMESPFGEVRTVYVDRAKSGKDTNRPQLQRLLQAIRKEEISLVMVTELSRLSRSIRDFSDIWELMRAHNCGFLSLREQFDTTTAAGEMVLYTVANISQFERKQVSERVSANFLARAKRGLFNGGSVPIGYFNNPEMKGHLLIDKGEAEVVRQIFATYLEEGRLVRTATVLNEKGYRLPRRRIGRGGNVRLGHFTIDNVQSILKNPTYTGLRAYQEDGKAKLSKGCWEAIIDQTQFDRVQALLKRNYETRAKLVTTGKRYPFLLSNIIYCATCSDHLTGKSAHGNSGKVPYYEHGWAVKRQSSLNKKIFSCAPHRIPARIIEPLVWEDVVQLLTDRRIAIQLIDKARETHRTQSGVLELDRYRAKVRGIVEQQEALAEHLSKIPKSVSPVPIFNQMERLEALRKQFEEELKELEQSGNYCDEPASLKSYERYVSIIREHFSKAASADERAKIVRALIAKVEVLEKSVKIHFKVGERAISLPLDRRGMREDNEGKPLKDSVFSDLDNKKPAEQFFWSAGSNRLTNGGGAGN